MTIFTPPRVLLYAKDMPVVDEREREVVGQLEQLARYKERAPNPALLAGLEKEIYNKLEASIPEDIAPQVHVFPWESEKRLRMSLLVQDLRSKTTGGPDFRDLTAQVYRLLVQHVFERNYQEQGVPLVVDTRVTSPVQQRSVQLIPDMAIENPVIAVLMRAGLYPSLVVGKELERMTGKVPEYALLRPARPREHGVSRKDLTHVLEYDFNSGAMHDRDVLVPEPMLATGGSLIGVHKYLSGQGIKPKSMTILGTIGAYEGTILAARHIPGLKIHLAWLDPLLNDLGYICPGLGDAGDQLNGNTEELGLLLGSYGTEFCRVHEKQIEAVYKAQKEHAPGILFSP